MSIASGLGRGPAKMQGQLHFLEIFDRTVDSLELLDILPQGMHKPLGMLGRQDDPRLDLTLRCAGHDIDKIEYKLGMAMGDNGQVRILPLGHLLGYFNIELILFGCSHLS